MKKFTLLLIFLCGATLTFSQVSKSAFDAPVGQVSALDKTALPGTVKGSGDVFWSTSFNWANPADERGWTLPDGWSVVDATDLGNVWMWRNDTIKGRRTVQPAPDHFVTGSDGFICIPLDEYNFRDGVTTANTADSHITTAPIDCSAVSSVVVRFSQFFRLCCSNYNLEMLVTNDAGVHWATYNVRYGTPGNNNPIEKYRNIEINISDVAAGLPSVQIRFYIYGMAYYYWMIDDLSLSEAYDYDVVLEDTWLDFDGGVDATVEHINYWPLSQMGMPGTSSGTVGNYYMKAALLNNGKQDSEDTRLRMSILKNGAEVLNEVAPPSTIWTLERDTQQISNPYLATDYGDYRFDYSAEFANEDENPVNNTTSMYFTVNDTMGHRADFTPEAWYNSGSWTGGGNAGDMLVVNYNLYAATEINSITAYLGTFTAAQTPQFQFVLKKDIDGAFEDLIASDVTEMDSSLMNSWVTLPIIKDGETEFVEPGLYCAGVIMWGVLEGDANGTQGMTIGRDLSTKYAGCAHWFVSDGGWHTLAGAPLWQIGFNVNKSGGPTAADVTFNVDMNAHIANGEFHPGTDNVDVKGFTSVWTGPAAMTDTDGDGIYTATVAGLPVNSKIEFKYRINGVEEAYPTTGNLHRNYTIRYWNVINSRFNNGVTAGIKTEELISSFNVYPNPTSGSFTVSFSSTVPVNAEISLVNINGQEVYSNHVSNVTAHTETIDNPLSKGIYFLRVNNGREVKVQKVVVQ
ncbi:MAG: T9SS type A sorting domain-containing protein [Bacteroidota bacterium]